MAGVPLPRLPGRLTAELVLRSPQGLNAVKQYEINLRGALHNSGHRPLFPSFRARLRPGAGARTLFWAGSRSRRGRRQQDPHCREPRLYRGPSPTRRPAAPLGGGAPPLSAGPRAEAPHRPGRRRTSSTASICLTTKLSALRASPRCRDSRPCWSITTESPAWGNWEARVPPAEACSARPGAGRRAEPASADAATLPRLDTLGLSNNKLSNLAARSPALSPPLALAPPAPGQPRAALRPAFCVRLQRRSTTPSSLPPGLIESGRISPGSGPACVAAESVPPRPAGEHGDQKSALQAGPPPRARVSRPLRQSLRAPSLLAPPPP